MISLEEFQAALSGLQNLLPMARPLGAAAMVLAWDSFPLQAKADLTDEILLFAIQQRLQDPTPPRDVAPHLSLLRYCYPCERTIRRERGEEVITDSPILERGLRKDLAQRMAAPDRFHDTGPSRIEQAPAPQLPAGRPWHPGDLSIDARATHLQRIKADVERICQQGPGDLHPTRSQLSQGRWWYERALAGYWGLHCDAGGLAAAWICRNQAWAEQLLSAAIEQPITVTAEPVVAGFVEVSR